MAFNDEDVTGLLVSEYPCTFKLISVMKMQNMHYK